MKLHARGVYAGYDRREVLRAIDLSISDGSCSSIVGPNGSGKSTLLKVLAGILPPRAGAVELDGQPLRAKARREIAQDLAILPQQPLAPEGMTVYELVEQGLYPQQGPLRMLRRQHHRAIAGAIEATGMVEFAQRRLETLSGGERQRAWLALALAQMPRFLLLDEPTTFLDIRHQLEILELIGNLRRERNLGVVMVLHDLNSAARFSERIVVLDKGTIVGDGAPNDIITSETMARVFGVEVSIMHDQVTSSPIVSPHRVVRNTVPAGDQP